ncbi:hypothetical protein CERSUDRAFT_99085 [Gelatoporia subvermispora B]|uniref:glutathione transferase n=1 Tax=Ceriporiopsis subvermispora (strain B) TaxID=914234 RepID=M2Q791_CERS8|nr:hypothetical protein CERSUDRAFT_99085 [Gelatoporia subvermispora B]
MALILHGSANSTCVQRVMTVLKKKNAPFELVPGDFVAREHRYAAYLEKNPLGQIPYLHDDGTQLLPPSGDLHKLAKFEQAASMELSQFDPSAAGLATKNIFKKRFGMKPDKEGVEQYKARLIGKLDAYEKILSHRKYLAGNEITLADLFHLPCGAMLKEQGYGFFKDESRPNIVRWWEDISSPRPGRLKDGA